MKWITIKQWVDTETGEALTKQLAETEYHIISTTKYTKHVKYRTYHRYILYECRKATTKQLQLF